MLWLVCLIITILLMVLCVRECFDKQHGSMRVLYALVYLFVATYVIYIPAFLDAYEFLSGLIGNIVHVLQVITLDADFMQYYEVIRDGIGGTLYVRLYMVVLGVLHITLPAISAFSAVALLFRCFSSIQVFFANKSNRPMFVFSQLNERSLHLADSLKKTKCDIIFADSDHSSLSNEDTSKLGFVFKEESINDLKIKVKKNKDIHFLCLSDDEDQSLSCTLKLFDKYTKFTQAEQEHIHIYQFTRQEDFSVYIDSANKGSLDVQCINEYEMLIYNLLDRYPLYRYCDSYIHVLLYGLSDLNMVALKAILWCGCLIDTKLRISVVGTSLKTKIDELKVSTPGVFSGRYDVNFYDCEDEMEVVRVISENCSDANYIMLSEKTDNDTMSEGIKLRRLFYRLDPNFSNCPPIFCYIKEPSKFNIVGNLATAESKPERKMSYSLTPFGSLSEVYSYESLIDSPLEKLAKNVHLAYEEIFSDGEIDVKQALERYNVFEVNKRSNRANALHIRYKLSILGLDYVKDDGSADGVSMKDYYSEEAVNKLAVAEHDRWMAFLETEGWLTAEKDEVCQYKKSGISKGRHNCPLLKMHPYICEYDKLFDLSMELEGKDTTVYDRELVVRIPDILSDKWQVAGKKYKIVERNTKHGISG